MIKDHGVEEYTFKENQAMAQINFDWQNPDEGMFDNYNNFGGKAGI